MDRHPIIQVERVNSKWYHFDITFRINLKAILKFIILLAISAGVIFVGYWLMKGAVALAGLIWEGLYWLSRQGLWLLGAVVLAFLIWALTKVNWCNIKVGANIWKYILRILALIVAILCLIFCFRSCNKEDKIIDDGVVVIDNSKDFERQFDETFDYVVISRAYLDGVQNAGDKIKRALVGLKYVDGKPVSPDDFSYSLASQ